MQWQSPAKINLHLRVGEVRPDGFHPLNSWMVTVGLFDKLSFEFLPKNASDGPPWLTLQCDDPEIPTDESNLIKKASWAWIRHRTKIDRVSLRLWAIDQGRLQVVLSKSIPSGGGLGGGSSNAATTL